MITSITYVFLILGVLAFGIGYRKIDRNLMLAGAVLLTLSGGMSDFVTGWQSVM